MIADFCNDLWDTRIESDTVSSDGYEVCNLLSRVTAKKQRGFLAARFVKPVVSLLVSFPFPIDVCAINVNPKVGGQKMCGLEILSASLKYHSVKNNQVKSNPNPNNFEGKSSRNPRVCRGLKAKSNDKATSDFHSYEHNLNVNNIKQEFRCFFNQILRVQMPEGHVGHFANICFQNSDFESRILGSSPDSIQSCNLQHGNQLHNTTHLWIRITQVHKGSVPCLGALEVFGKPTKTSSEFVMNYARIITLRLKQEREKPAESSLSARNMCKSEVVLENYLPCTNSLVDNIPAEFIDPITFNIMTMPILLPSGTTIDDSTLEKHIATEQKWGCQPSDPFTGVPLRSRVVPNAALKYRIDNFLLSAGVKADELGRTVGSSSDCLSTTKLKFDAILKEKSDKMHMSGAAKRKASMLELKQPFSKKQNTDSLDQALENLLSVGQKSSNITPNVATSSLVSVSLLGQNDSAQPNTAEPRDSVTTSNQGCPHQEQTSVLFHLPCQHVICRQCLTRALETKQCLYCQENFEKRDVVRVHSKNKASVDTNAKKFNVQ